MISQVLQVAAITLLGAQVSPDTVVTLCNGLSAPDYGARFRVEEELLRIGPEDWHRSVAGLPEETRQYVPDFATAQRIAQLLTPGHIGGQWPRDETILEKRRLTKAVLGSIRAKEGVTLFDAGDDTLREVQCVRWTAGPIVAVRDEQPFRLTLVNVGHFVEPPVTEQDAARLFRWLSPGSRPVDRRQFDRIIVAAKAAGLTFGSTSEAPRSGDWGEWVAKTEPPWFGLNAEASEDGVKVKALVFVERMGSPRVLSLECLFTNCGYVDLTETAYLHGPPIRWSRTELSSIPQEPDRSVDAAKFRAERAWRLLESIRQIVPQSDE